MGLLEIVELSLRNQFFHLPTSSFPTGTAPFHHSVLRVLTLESGHKE